MLGLGIGVALERAAAKAGLTAVPVRYPHALPINLYTAIRAIGVAPFVAVAVGNKRDDVLICRSHLDTAAFDAALGDALHAAPRANLLIGLQAALRGEIGEAAHAFLDWVQSPGDVDRASRIYFNGRPGVQPEHHLYYPVFDLDGGPTTIAQRGAMLEGALHAYEKVAGNEPARHRLIEALAFALAAHLAIAGRHAEALRHLDRLELDGTTCLNFGPTRRALESGQTPTIPDLRPLPDDIGKVARQSASGFFTVRVPSPKQPVVATCETHLALPEFRAWLSGSVAAFPDSNLLKALHFGMQGETFLSASAFYDWVHAPSPRDVATQAYFNGVVGSLSERHVCYPAFDLCADATTIDHRGAMLEGTLHAYAQIAGNEPARLVLVEALAFAVVRHCATISQFCRGLDYLDRLEGDGSGPYLNFERCRDALRREQVPVIPNIAPLPSDVRAVFERLGFRAFLTVRLVSPEGAQSVTACATHLEAPPFTQWLSEAVKTTDSNLLKGLDLALQGETYLAAFALYDWVYAPTATDRISRIHFNNQTGTTPDQHVCFPVFDLCAESTTERERGDMLIAAQRAYEQLGGHETMRYGLLAAFAFAAVRHFGTTGGYAGGLALLDRMDAIKLHFLHFRACRQALELLAHGSAVPHHLKKFVGPDDGRMKAVTCPVPFSEFSINPVGEVFLCCGHLVPTSIGNLQSQEAFPIWNSPTARNIRASMLDGSFRYCNHEVCASIARGSLPEKTDITVQSSPVMRAAVETGETHVEKIKWLYFGYDVSCNLSCPSCRREVIMEKRSDNALKVRTIDQRIKPLLPRVERLFLNSTCEFLVSRTSRDLLQSIDSTECPDLKVDLITNGTLFTRTEWDKFANAHDHVKAIRVSIDAAQPATFEAIRRGGRWPEFLDNLKFIAGMRAQGRIEVLYLAFTYQVGNFREMLAFMDFAREIGADYVCFDQLAKSQGMTEQEFAERAVHQVGHPLNGEFMELIKHPAFKQHIAMCDFST